jgi:glycerophosphoryl diester phosphodiesterase
MSFAARLADRYRQAREGGAPLAGGHRGNPAETPENTLASFKSAIELGVDLIECDVQLSADGQLVVIHDPLLDRTTSGSGLVIEHDLAQLKQLDAGGGERLPLLAEVCELARGRAGLCVETKQLPIPTPGVEDKLIDLLREMDMVGEACVVSFHHPSLLRIKEREPSLLTGVMLAELPVDPVGLIQDAQADIYAPHWSSINPQLVDELHSAGAAVGVWPVDDATAVKWCRRCRPDAIFTNRPRWLIESLRADPG